MKFRNSYQFKIFISLWIFGIVLVVIYIVLGHGLVFIRPNADRVATFWLKKEIAGVHDHFKTNGQPLYPNSRFYKSYLDVSNLPSGVRDKIDNLENGYHYIDTTNASGNHQGYYVAVFNQPDKPERFFVLHDHTGYTDEYIDFLFFRASRRLALGITIVGILGIFMGLFASKRLISPLKKLSRQVKDLNPENLPTAFSQGFKEDEIGILANALETSMRRIQEFIEREKNFTRDASHELRTPVTVIKGAVELIHQLPECKSPSIARPMGRIERSADNMEEIIEAFLWLAREQGGTLNETSCRVGDIVRYAVDDNQHMVAAKPITVVTSIEANPWVQAPEAIIRIAVENLIRNAFQYTNSGQISITVTPESVEILNTGAKISPDTLNTIKKPFQKGEDSTGIGIGLAIVERLCQKFNFKLDIDSDINSRTRARLTIAA